MKGCTIIKLDLYEFELISLFYIQDFLIKKPKHFILFSLIFETLHGSILTKKIVFDVRKLKVVPLFAKTI